MAQSMWTVYLKGGQDLPGFILENLTFPVHVLYHVKHIF